MSVPAKLPDVTVSRTEALDWIRKKHLKKTKANITRATNALRAEKQKDSLPLGRDVSVSATDQERQVIYGQCRVGGALTFLDVRGSNQYFDIVATISTHEIEAVDKVYLDDAEVLPTTGTDGWSRALRKPDGSEIAALNKVFYRVATGADGQSAVPDLVGQNPTKWGLDHKQSGCAHVYIILVWDAALFGDGVPEISFLVRGKKCRDPRTALTTYTTNAALCAADYLTDTRYGLGVPLSRIDDTSLSAAATECDQDINLLGGGLEKKYTTNGYFNTSESHGRILERMAAAMGGHITYSNGLWKFWPAKWRTPSLTLTVDDIRSPIRIQTLASREDIFNAVRGVFVSAAKGFIETDYPPVKNSSYAALDGNDIYENIDFHFVTSTPTAQRLAKLELERIRQGIQIELLTSLKAYQLQVPENVYLTLERYGWDAKPFEVTKADLVLDENAPELLVSLSLRETAQGVFDWNYWEETIGDVAPNTNLPSPFTVPTPSGLIVTSGTSDLYLRGDGTVAPRIRLEWSAFTDFFITSGGEVQVQFKPSATNVWLASTPVPAFSTLAYVTDVQDGQYYDVRIRAVNAFKVTSDWITIGNHFVIGKTAPPADVHNFAVVVTDFGLQLQWEEISDIDRDLYEIREGSSWDTAVVVSQSRTTRLALPLRAAGDYTFFIKAIDTSGNYSSNASSASTTIFSPTIPAGVTLFQGPNLVLDWDEAISGSWSIEDYSIYYGATFAGATFLASTKATAYTIHVSWLGGRKFWIEPRDVYGNVGTPFAIDTNVLAPNSVTNLRPETIDNNVLLRWDVPTQTTLPIEKFIVKKGDTYSGATLIGEHSGTFAAIFELISGRFTYWVEAVDTAGNSGTSVPTVAVVSEPPDFELKSDLQLTDGTLLNVVESPAGTVVGPFDTSQTWAQHFSGNGWNTPQDQIDAGFPYYLQPTAKYGRWEKIHDFTTTLNNILLHLSYARTDIVGSQTVTPKIAWSTNNISYTEQSGVLSALADAVRYVRIRLDFGTVP